MRLRHLGLQSAIFLLLATLVSIQVFADSKQKSALWGDLRAGSYNVGFRIKIFFDKNRKDVRTDGRPVRVMIWYPAQRRSASRRMVFQDYVSQLDNSLKRRSETEIREWLSTSVSGDPNGVEGEILNKILNSKMRAVRNARTVNKRFPLVLWTMRHETFIAQSVLCEFLASHGYVVATARYGGEPMPFPWTIKTDKEKKEVFSTHLSDLSFALKKLENEADVKRSKVTIMNWSYAAELSPLMQMQNPNVGLVIGLSSNPLSSFGLYQGADAVKNLKPERLNVPYVFMTELIGANGKKRIAPEIFNNLSAETYFVSFAKLAHGNFNVLEGLIPGVFRIDKVQPWSKGGKDAKIGYQAISEITLYFLNRYMKERNRADERKLKRKLSDWSVTISRYWRT